MTSIKGHFDGNAVVLDEPASLHVGQAVRVIVEPVSEPPNDLQGADDDGSAAARLAALSAVQQSLGLSGEGAEAWSDAVRAERAAWLTPG